ncbi:MAG TPA: hypothetical protein VHS09_04745, partial [Polyangiaceae bacterium]|nr:hypothetical protein [Polyangiaceae bacterium]
VVAGLVVFVIIIIIFAIVKAASANVNTSVGAIDALARKGLRARGLVLTCNQLSFGVTLGGRRFERRTMTLDVEIPGRAPFIINGTFLVPRGIVEATPGSSLELAVHPTKAGQIAVLGPGGFTGPWLNYGPPNQY